MDKSSVPSLFGRIQFEGSFIRSIKKRDITSDQNNISNCFHSNEDEAELISMIVQFQKLE